MRSLGEIVRERKKMKVGKNINYHIILNNFAPVIIIIY